MKNRLTINRTLAFALALALVCNFYATGQKTATQATGPYGTVCDLGKMTRFYRNQPSLPGWWKCMANPPAFLMDKKISFPYMPRPYPKEILFADHVTLVRFLGGWSPKHDPDYLSKDLAYRNKEGKIRYRWELIPERMNQTLENGYKELTIVLDNTPWCFPLDPHEPEGEGYGQCAQPRDLDEWATFIEDLCRELAKRYGAELANRWRFRLGTEAAGQNRFKGSEKEYEAFYVATARAVKRALPGAQFGPYNRASGGDPMALAALARRCAKEGIPFDFLCFSTYNIAQMNDNDKVKQVDPDEIAHTRIHPLYDSVVLALGERIPCEIHEYGWFLKDEWGNGNSEMGARGAAGNFYYQFSLRREGIDRLYHWIMRDDTFENQTPLIGGQGWLYSIYDHLVGKHVYELHTETAIIPDPAQRFKSIGFFDSGSSYVIATSYNMDRNVKKINAITIYIPRALATGRTFSMVSLSDRNDPYVHLREDFARMGMLTGKVADHPHVIGTIRQMAGPKGLAYVKENYPRYEKMMRNNLTLKKFTGTAVEEGDFLKLTLPVECPETVVIKIE